MPISPVDVPQTDDPGDETQRNFRYQHAYGVILLIGASSGALPYISIYAEHHEDFLCERSDGRYDAIQVKTKRDGDEWTLSDEGMKNSLKRFAFLERQYSEYMAEYRFASNAAFSRPNSSTKNRKAIVRSPYSLYEEVESCSCSADLPELFKEVFAGLAQDCSCSEEVLFAVFQKIRYVEGPTRKDFLDVVCSTHLGSHESCRTYPHSTVVTIRDELMYRVWKVSSLDVRDPAKHWSPMNVRGPQDPILQSKKLWVDTVRQVIENQGRPPFRYSSARATLTLDETLYDHSRMKQKMIHGELTDQVELISWRVDSTYTHLTEWAYKYPNIDTLELPQLHGVVLAECLEAYLEASLSPEPFGRQMLVDVHKRLKHIAETHSEKVFGHSYETLIGLVGILTGMCEVWWSPRFDLAAEE